ncbi:DUF6615 family protein [Jatrophihabitans sp.]|uniref:DUF6615 family protein n=1 Tax=Jatrophihabitans sp. TaxID=1932789 RepID=UPI002C5DAB54|nr:DUF6615 family protein [Jatrophihabitans sp.]
MLTPAQVRQLRDELNRLASSTWHKVEVGPRRGLAFGEESITDHNLFELDRRCTGVEVYKFYHREEALNGADFEWYIGDAADGWIGIRFQAKKLDDEAYLGLGHRVGTQRQYDILLKAAAADGLWPLYCFYNGWSGAWPNGIRNAVCPNGFTPARTGIGKGCRHAKLEHFGCALAPASYVARRHRSAPRVGRLALDDYLAHSRPWSHIFEIITDRSDPLDSSTVIRQISATLHSWFAASASDGQETVEPDYVLGIPDNGGRLVRLPPWLMAVRQGEARYDDGYLPRLALVLDLDAVEGRDN